MPVHRAQIITWWETKEISTPLVIGLDAKGSAFCIYNGFPQAQDKAKAVYFLKPEEGFAVTKDNCTQLIRGDLAPARVEGLEALVADFLGPVISNERNANKWSDVVKKDLINEMADLQSVTSIVIGQMQGQSPVHPICPTAGFIPPLLARTTSLSSVFTRCVVALRMV